MVQVLKSAEAGRILKDVYREYEVSHVANHNRKAKCGGIDASGTLRLNDLEEKNRRLKKMFAALTLENLALKDMTTKALKPSERRLLVNR